MTKLLDEAIAKARELSDADQDMAAEAVLSVVYKDTPRSTLTPEQVEEVKRIQQDMREGKTRFATDEEMTALWRKCGL
jgi:ABC-type histidine transport system ATPase subunit